MKATAGVVGMAVVAVLSMGCDAASRYKVLSTLFDGVPPPTVAMPATKTAGLPADESRARKIRYGMHGPYAARLCDACHQPMAGNALVLPREQLCFKCHEFTLNKKYIHGPLASGGCIACHDPHGSQYRYFLVSESASFCVRCHEPQAIARTSAHAGVEGQCTACHDAHMSDKKYLLR